MDNKFKYVELQIEVVEVEIEQGYAVTDGSPDPFTPSEW